VLRAIGFVVSAMLVGSMAGARAFAQVADIDATGLIKLDVSVTDAAGRPVANLGPADFTLLDNGQPAHIRTFEVLGRPDPTLEVILLIDTLRIPGALAEQVRLTAEEFLHRLEPLGAGAVGADRGISLYGAGGKAFLFLQRLLHAGRRRDDPVPQSFHV
jgi:hypothetical protein